MYRTSVSEAAAARAVESLGLDNRDDVGGDRIILHGQSVKDHVADWQARR